MLRALGGGRALEVFRKMIAAQGGDPKVVDDPSLLPRARHVVEVRSPASGYVRQVDAFRVGLLGTELGVGRKKVGARVEPAAGFVFRRKVGDAVEPGDVLLEVHAASRRVGEEVGRSALSVFTIGRAGPNTGERVIARMSS
jgi:thymidine phosphorylase